MKDKYWEKYKQVHKKEIQEKRHNSYLKQRDLKLDNQKKYYQNNKEKRISYAQKYRADNHDKILIIRKKRYNERKDEIKIIRKNYYNKNKKHLNMYNIKTSLRLKMKVFNHYTNFNIKCNCCGENMIEFLSIDHVNNDGAEHRKKVHSGSSLYYWLINNNYPSGYQILCMNCNFAKGKDKDHICPHRRKIAEILLK